MALILPVEGPALPLFPETSYWELSWLPSWLQKGRKSLLGVRKNAPLGVAPFSAESDGSVSHHYVGPI